MEIRVDRLSKDFADTPALKDVSLTIQSGELLALLGPSGSGKTTLLRSIAGLEIPDSGRVFFGDEDATDVPVQKRGVGFVFQHYALFRHMSVADNIAYGLRVRPRAQRPSSDDIDARISRLLALVQLDNLGGRYPMQLSGGQRQRVALARALAVEPRVLLLDEPFGALDAKVRKDLRRWLRDIHEKTGQTTIFVTHDQDEALELADRVAILKDGAIEQVGTPEQIHLNPASAFVMGFIGDTTRLAVEGRDEALWHHDIRLTVTRTSRTNGPTDLYVRPWDFELVDEQAADGLAGIVGAVKRSAGVKRATVKLIASGQLVEAELPLNVQAGPQDKVFLRVLRGVEFDRS